MAGAGTGDQLFLALGIYGQRIVAAYAGAERRSLSGVHHLIIAALDLTVLGVMAAFRRTREKRLFAGHMMALHARVALVHAVTEGYRLCAVLHHNLILGHVRLSGERQGHQRRHTHKHVEHQHLFHNASLRRRLF